MDIELAFERCQDANLMLPNEGALIPKGFVLR
jgi:hypothetical protein